MPTAPLPLSGEVTADLMRFIAASPSPYHAVLDGARRLADIGFVGVDERASWVDTAAGGPARAAQADESTAFPRRGFMIRGGALLAWVLPEGSALRDGVRIIGAHTDSPNLRIKPIAETGAAGWRQLGVEVYGGPLLNSWLDRDLGLSGRVALRTGDVRLVRIDEPLARVPQLAIHLDREVNERGVQLDKQLHLTPVWGIGDVRPGQLAELIAAKLAVSVGDILACDLMLHDLTPPALIGADRELLASARLDNLCSSHGALTALASVARRPDAQHGALIALFDHEEVGSETATGAAGPLLPMVLNRLARATGGGPEDMDRMCAASVCLSADMAHAVHPNYSERHEPMHRPLPNGGPVVKSNASARYATDAPGAAVFIDACEAAGVPWQRFVSRNSMPCGSTIGPITSAKLGITTVDVGCAQLSMHSARELMGAHDPAFMAAAMTQFLLA